MRFHHAWWMLVVLGLAAGKCLAQQSTAVQLPTYSFFGTSTTVSVPDRGSVYMGGIKRAESGSSSYRTPLAPFGPFGNRSIGSSRSAMGTSVKVWIHDFEAMDEYLLSQPTPYNTSRARDADPWVRRLAAAQPDSTGRPAPGPVDIQARLARKEQTRRAEAVNFFQRGRKAEAEGKANVARIYYQMAARRAEADLKDQILARLAMINSMKKTAAVGQNRP